MRYIRTTDGRIGYLHREPNEKATDYEMLTSSGMLTYHNKDEVIKVADNVEELFDEVVEYGNRPIVITQANVKRGRMSGKTRIIYGAIWTEKGLIYAAKMKGVLPNGEIDWELI